MTKPGNRAIMDKFPNEGIKIIGRLKNLIFEKGAITTRTDKILKKMKKVLDKREKT